MDLDSLRGFCDINIVNFNEKLFDNLLEYGYRAIAINYTVDATSFEGKHSSKKKKNNGEEILTTVKPPAALSTSSWKNFASKQDKLRIFNRMTIVFSKPEQLRMVFDSPHYRKYDIIAALPTTPAAYQYACGCHTIDLLSFEIGVTDYKPSRKPHKQLVDRNGYFEITYAPALKSSVKRQETITMAHCFYIYGKSKNVIISSGATNYMDLRNPYDVSNLGLLFGLTEEAAKCGLSKNVKLLLQTALGRKYGKTAITVHVDPSEENTDEPNCKRFKKSENILMDVGE